MFKNLKSLFIEEDESSVKKSGKTKAKAEKTTSSSTPSKATVKESKGGEPGKVTMKFSEILLKAMDAHNLDGFDYIEYKQSLKSLEKMPMDEATRYQSAYAMAQTMGATPDKLVKTAQHYIDILQQEEKKFEEALSHQTSKQIGTKQQQINKLEEQIKAKAEQIKKLTQEIEADQKLAQKLKREIDTAGRKVASTKNDFIASYNSLVQKINNDIENMRKYLK